MTDQPARPGWLTWSVRAVAAAALAVVAWVCLTEWGAVANAHPAYPVLLALTTAGALIVLARSLRPRRARTGVRRVLELVLVVASIGLIAVVAWLRPMTAQEPALSALHGDDRVTVRQTATTITLTPVEGADNTGVFFQPGAKVDARAYAAVLRPLAEAGHTVVIAKQPLGIAFLAVGAFDSARAAHPEVARWVVGGHSLGGVVASTEADADDSDSTAPVVGLLLYASYPAGDISSTLKARVESVSGSRDGLSTPAKIDASRADLPADATFTVVEGAVHAYFGDYGVQPGDGTPTISHDEARDQISSASVAFVGGLAGTTD